MKGWAKLDGNLILIFEIVLMLFLLNMNATDTVLQLKSGTCLQQLHIVYLNLQFINHVFIVNAKVPLPQT